MIKRIICLSLVVLFGFAAGICLAKYSGGDGSEATPYRISNANDMNEIGLHDEDWGSHFVMVNDVNLADYTGEEFNLIGTYNPTNPFTGIFDGNGFTISNFTYNTTMYRTVGLFGFVDDVNAVLKDLVLIDPNINSGGNGVGSLVGILFDGTITNCYVEDGSVSGESFVGGLVGVLRGTITNCYATGNVTGTVYITGGLLGLNEGGTISNCYAISDVNGYNHTGGLVGQNGIFDVLGTISNCYATGDVNGYDRTGGLVGFHYFGTIEYSYAAVAVGGGNPSTGGLIGYDFNFNSTYTKCFWDSDINPDVNGIGNTTDPNVIGKSTSEMQKESTFTDWDFVEIWNIGENQTYPFLRTYPAGDLNHDGRVDGRDLAIIATHWLDGIQI